MKNKPVHVRAYKRVRYGAIEYVIQNHIACNVASFTLYNQNRSVTALFAPYVFA